MDSKTAVLATVAGLLLAGGATKLGYDAYTDLQAQLAHSEAQRKEAEAHANLIQKIHIDRVAELEAQLLDEAKRHSPPSPSSESLPLSDASTSAPKRCLLQEYAALVGDDHLALSPCEIPAVLLLCGDWVTRAAPFPTTQCLGIDDLIRWRSASDTQPYHVSPASAETRHSLWYAAQRGHLRVVRKRIGELFWDRIADTLLHTNGGEETFDRFAWHIRSDLAHLPNTELRQLHYEVRTGVTRIDRTSDTLMFRVTIEKTAPATTKALISPRELLTRIPSLSKPDDVKSTLPAMPKAANAVAVHVLPTLKLSDEMRSYATQHNLTIEESWVLFPDGSEFTKELEWVADMLELVDRFVFMARSTQSITALLAKAQFTPHELPVCEFTVDLFARSLVCALIDGTIGSGNKEHDVARLATTTQKRLVFRDFAQALRSLGVTESTSWNNPFFELLSTVAHLFPVKKPKGGGDAATNSKSSRTATNVDSNLDTVLAKRSLTILLRTTKGNAWIEFPKL